MSNEAAKIPKSSKKHTPRYDTARVEALFASMGEGVIATDESGYITRVNQVALEKLWLSQIRSSRQTSHRLLLPCTTMARWSTLSIAQLQKPT